MTELLSATEGEPSSWPSQPAGLSTAAADLDTDALWQRIEAWISHRWQERTVTWVVQGPGTWAPPLKPATIDTSEVWNDGAWESVTLTDAPLGYELDCKTFRVTATVGGTDNPPEAVQEAYRRLAEYLADQSHIGRVATSGSRQLSDLQITSERPASWQARAIHHSGAADMLRPWRR